MNPNIQDEYNKRLEMKTNKIKKSTSKGKVNLVFEEDNNDIQLSDITSIEILNRAVDAIMMNLKTTEQYIKEIHEYTQILPEKYYKPGSHVLNRQVAFALKHTDQRLFLSWVMLRTKADDFDYLVLFDKDLIIIKSKVLIYREDYGGEIGSKRWLSQFISKNRDSILGYGEEITAISGATISVKSMTASINHFLYSLKEFNNETPS